MFAARDFPDALMRCARRPPPRQLTMYERCSLALFIVRRKLFGYVVITTIVFASIGVGVEAHYIAWGFTEGKEMSSSTTNMLLLIEWHLSSFSRSRCS